MQRQNMTCVTTFILVTKANDYSDHPSSVRWYTLGSVERA